MTSCTRIVTQFARDVCHTVNNKALVLCDAGCG